MLGHPRMPPGSANLTVGQKQPMPPSHPVARLNAYDRNAMLIKLTHKRLKCERITQVAQKLGLSIAECIAKEVKVHERMTATRPFALDVAGNEDRRRLVSGIWRDLARPGSLWMNVRIVHDGRDLHPSNFMTGQLAPGLAVHSFIEPAAVARLLNEGATLIYNDLQETSVDIRQIQEVLEYQLGAKIWIQAFLTKAKKTSFGVHRDIYDFVALQLLGRKNWNVETADSGHAQMLLHPGDGIFLRSNTEHAVAGVGEISLHLTIGIDWLSHTDSLPGSAVRAAETEKVEQKFRMGTFLPVAMDPSTLDDEVRVRLADRVRPVVKYDAGHVDLTCVAGRFQLDQRLAPVLEVLLGGGEWSVSDLAAEASTEKLIVRKFAQFGVQKFILLCGLRAIRGKRSACRRRTS